MWHEFSIQTKAQTEFVPLTELIGEALAKTGIRDGQCSVFIPHTTAGVTVNENADPDVMADLRTAFDKMVPGGPYRHGEGNSPAHFKATLVGCSVSLPVIGGHLALGTWQGVFFCEFDGPRRRRVMVGCQAG